MKHLANFFNKPSMSFEKIIMLGLCELFLIMLKEWHGRFYGMANAVYHALFVAVILALFIQFIRLNAEVKAGK